MGKCHAASWLSIWFLLLAGYPAKAQQLDHLLGELLLQLRPGADGQALAGRLPASLMAASAPPPGYSRLAGPLNIWRCTFDHTRIDERQLLEQFRSHPLVENAQYNHFIQPRTTLPNDPQFPKQWQYLNTGQSGGRPGVDLDMELVWDITTGGLAASGDTIVVCVIDEGLDLAHEDFAGNLWINHHEIPGNGIDDDGNGYTDDYLGWNTLLNNDNIDVDRGHGTPVAGIVGARGNNGAGVSGVNWNVKLMIVAGGIGLESEALEAYAYPLAQRRRYNATNGRGGAFVVATNASWGVDFGNPADFPLWCALYDTLGAAGILNVAATADRDVNVDADGDMPTACSSDFLIGVTTTDDSGRRLRGFGYGARSIDLATFGEKVWTTAKGNRYAAFGGTSGAAPHVAGAIALLYAASCPSLMAVGQNDPAAAARLVKDYLLRGVTPEPTLAGVVLTGGRLNIYQSLLKLLDECPDCPPPTSLAPANLTDGTANLTWRVNDSIRQVDLRWRPLGADTWQVVRNALSPYQLKDLSPCREYEFQLRAYCRRDTLDFGPSQVFRTDGCCEPPAAFRLASRNDRSAAFQWSPVLAATQYRLLIRKIGESGEEISTGRLFHVFNNLEACTEYEVLIRSVCAEGPTGYSLPVRFSTLGCGPCRDEAYCVPRFIDASTEWIAEVSLHTLESTTGPDGGYGDFTEMATTELVPGQSYTIRLQPGFAGPEDFEYFQVWIDLNQDGRFDDMERVFDPGGATRGAVSGALTIPAGTPPGSTRLRVAMRYFSAGGPCSFLDRPFGEIEDYCVTITNQPTSCPAPASIDTTATGTTRIALRWPSTPNASGYLLRYRQKETATWQLLPVPTNAVTLDALTRCTNYEVQVKAICNGILGPFIAIPLTFRTACSTSIVNPGADLGESLIVPNPSRHSAHLQLNLLAPQHQLRLLLFDSNGRRLWTAPYQLETGHHRLPIPIEGYAPGLYWLRIIPDHGHPTGLRLVKID